MAGSSSTPGEDSFSYWIYNPNKAASILFAVLFLISGVLHLWQNNIKYRSWRIGFLLPWAASVFVAGFILRAYGAFHVQDLAIFIASTVLLFVGPPVYTGAGYFIFGRLLYYLPYLSPIHPGRVWTTFVALDAVVEALAGNGASRAANSKNTPDQQRLGLNLVRGSLIMLLIMYLGFIWLVVIFHQRAVRGGLFTRNIKMVIYTLYATSTCVLLRNTLRLATFYNSGGSYINSHEWVFYVLEVVPMLTCTVLWNIFPPAKYLAADHRIYLAKDGKTEMMGTGRLDTRPFLLTLVDPFDVCGLILGWDRRNRFWEEDGIGGPLKESGPTPVPLKTREPALMAGTPRENARPQTHIMCGHHVSPYV